MPLNISQAMRRGQPEKCQLLDRLRAERKKAVERRGYLISIGNEGDSAVVQERITELDAEIATLHAHVHQLILRDIGTDLTQGAALLQLATTDAQKIRTCK